ncbi:MAG: PHP domain-containing protein [Dehalococcoidia bacterium]|nr:PHP domain-containing protein [Dehalococcoidia bacterium]
MSIGDFHMHSTYSDGRLTPTELVDLAASRGVRVMALSDHDTLASLPEAQAAAARYPGFLLVPAVEISCDLPGTELHMLGLFIDGSNALLAAELDSFRQGRQQRGIDMVAALKAAGAPISWDRVLELAGEAAVGRPHLALALMEQGHVASVNEAFDRFLARGMPAYVERDTIGPADAITMIRDAGGLPVFAHPSFTKEYEAVAAMLSSHGLFGMEVYYKAYEPPLVESLRGLAERLGLFALGGSDYHALGNPDEREPGDIPLPDSVVHAFLEVARAAGCAVPEPTPA